MLENINNAASDLHFFLSKSIIANVVEITGEGS